MARNIELKIAVNQLDDLRQRVAAIADAGPALLRQDDYYFRTRHGRLKLRIENDLDGRLIYYERADRDEARLSRYHVVAVPGESMLGLLEDALGLRGVVRKERELFLHGRTRIHLDCVRGLGTFIELEAVLEQGEHPENGFRDVSDLLTRLQLADSPVVAASYIDLVAAAGSAAAPTSPL